VLSPDVPSSAGARLKADPETTKISA